MDLRTELRTRSHCLTGHLPEEEDEESSSMHDRGARTLQAGTVPSPFLQKETESRQVSDRTLSAGLVRRRPLS